MVVQFDSSQKQFCTIHFEYTDMFPKMYIVQKKYLNALLLNEQNHKTDTYTFLNVITSNQASFVGLKEAQTHFILVIDRRLLGCTDKRDLVGLLVNDGDTFK